MAADTPTRSNVLEDRRYVIGLTGTGASNPTKRHGDGMSVARQGVGVYRISFLNHPGALKAMFHSFRSDTVNALRGYTLTAGLYVAASGNTPGYVEVSVWSSTFVAAELAALQYLDLEFVFAEVGG